MKPQTNTDEHRDSRAATKLICLAFSLRPSRLRARQKIRCAFWRERRAGRCKAPRRRRCGGIVEERQRRRCPPAAAPLRAAARRPAGCVARSLHTAPGMLVARALPAGLGASSKMYTLFPDGPLAVKALSGINREDAKSAKNPRRRILSKRQRICTLVVQIRPAVVQICVHLCSSVVSFMPLVASRTGGQFHLLRSGAILRACLSSDRPLRSPRPCPEPPQYRLRLYRLRGSSA